MLAAQLSSKNLFILTRHSFDDASTGVNYVFWASSDEGPVKLVFSHQQPVVFIDHDVNLDDSLNELIESRKPLDMQALNWLRQQRKVDALYFSSLHRLNEFKQLAQLRNIELFESDVAAHERFLMERFIFGSCSVKGHFQSHNGYLEVINGIIKPSNYSPQLMTASVDIETNEYASQLYSIAVDSPLKKVVWVVNTDRKSSGYCHHEDGYDLYYVADEKDLLKQFFATINAIDPDVIIGWNVVGFDIRVIAKKCKQYDIKMNLGRGYRTSQFKPASDNHFSNMPRVFMDGRVVVDGIEALRSAFYQFDSFALDFVASQLLNEEKQIDKSVDKMDEINRMFAEDKRKLGHYNYVDTKLVSDVFAKTSMIDFLIQKTKMTGLNFGRLGGSVAAFDFIYLPKLHRQKMVAQNIGVNSFSDNSPGGYVLSSQPGMYANVALLDFKSLYPSIIRTFYVDPYGLFQGSICHQPNDKNVIEGYVRGYDDALFQQQGSLLPNIIDHLWQLRDKAKLEKNLPLSQAIKIIMNSFYGVLGTKLCRFYHPQLASSITKRGHEIIQKTKEFIEAQGWQVIYGDTDSLFVHFGASLDEKSSKQQAMTLTQQINQWWQQSLQQDFAIDSHLEMEFETLFTKFYMPTMRGSDSGSKKRYAGWVTENKESPLVIKGLEAIRTDWVSLAKSMQTQLLTNIFTNKPYLDAIRDTVMSMKLGQLDHLLVFRKSLRKPVGEYVKNVPPHAQAAKKMSLVKDNPSFRGKVSYVMTEFGPEPIERLPNSLSYGNHSDNIRLDYHYYLEHQIRPALEAILQSVGDDFEDLVSNQRRLF